MYIIVSSHQVAIERDLPLDTLSSRRKDYQAALQVRFARMCRHINAKCNYKILVTYKLHPQEQEKMTEMTGVRVVRGKLSASKKAMIGDNARHLNRKMPRSRSNTR